LNSHVDTFHPRISVQPHSLTRSTLDAYLEALAQTGLKRSGVYHTFLEADNWERSLTRFEQAGVDCAYLAIGALFKLDKPESWDERRGFLQKAIDLAGHYDRRIYGISGPGPAVGLTWEEANDAFVSAVAPTAAYAQGHGVRLMIEPTLSMFSDIGFIHSQSDALEVADDAGLDVCVEVNVCWNERGLAETIKRSGEHIGLV
jgi:sugar phosphate isomerase/epimerase